jgi:hypothetical protein
MYCRFEDLTDDTATTYDPSVASAINAEFRELLIQELEKVEDRFFQVHDTSEDDIDELDATVIPYPTMLMTVA